MKPQRIPCVIENVSGIRMMVRNAGRPSSIAARLSLAAK